MRTESAILMFLFVGICFLAQGCKDAPEPPVSPPEMPMTEEQNPPTKDPVWLPIQGPAGLAPKDRNKKEKSWVVLGAKVKASDLEIKSTNIANALEGEKGDAVVVSGKIGEICPRGCWFYLQDDKDAVYVNVLGSLEVPQDAKGKKAVVKATVEGSGGGKTLEATTVLIEE